MGQGCGAIRRLKGHTISPLGMLRISPPDALYRTMWCPTSRCYFFFSVEARETLLSVFFTTGPVCGSIRIWCLREHMCGNRRGGHPSLVVAVFLSTMSRMATMSAMSSSPRMPRSMSTSVNEMGNGATAHHSLSTPIQKGHLMHAHFRVFSNALRTSIDTPQLKLSRCPSSL